MTLARQIKPISYLKTSTADAVRRVRKTGDPLFITQNGEAKIVVQDINSYEETQETLALFKILALGETEISRGETVSLHEASDRLRQQIDKRNSRLS